MPTTRRRRSRERQSVDGLTEATYLFFSWGDFFEAEGFADDKSPADLRRLWAKHRADIMARYMSELRAKGPGWAGKRPWAFWKWDMPEPQRSTPPGEFSAQRVWDHQRREYGWVETDWQYLQRLSLLADWELVTGDPHRRRQHVEAGARHADD